MTRFNNVKLLAVKEKRVENAPNASANDTKNGNNINCNVNLSNEPTIT